MGQFVIKALTGPVKGKSFPLRNGLRIGRTRGDILLKDNLVSDLHAEIQIYPSGQIMIVDQDSKNKIIIKGRHLVKSVLEEGSQFQIGETEFILKFVRTPDEILNEFIRKNRDKAKDQPLSLMPFSQPIEVVFSSGIQRGEKYCLYYGPRYFGHSSVDFPLFDKKAPEKAFQLVPDKKAIFFMTEHPSSVRLNKKSVEKRKIKSGDEVHIGNSILKIHLK